MLEGALELCDEEVHLVDQRSEAGRLGQVHAGAAQQGYRVVASSGAQHLEAAIDRRRALIPGPLTVWV